MTTLTDKTLTGLASEFRLSPGKHSTPAEGLCALELVAFLDGEPHTDRPRCACELVSAFVRSINDNMPDDARQKLLPYLPRLIGTVSDHEQEQERHDYFAWQTIRVFAPAALRAQGYRRFARVLQNAETLASARLIADTLQRGVANKEREDTPTPAALAVHHAGRAAGAAMWFADHHDDFLKGANSITPYTTCAEAAASAAFQAYRAGSADVWDRALDALEGVLSIGSTEKGSAMVASTVGAL